MKDPSLFLNVWHLSCVKVWKQFYKIRFFKKVAPSYLAFYQMPYGIHEGKYRTANELVQIDREEWLPRFIEEFYCGIDGEFKYLVSPQCTEYLTFNFYYIYKYNTVDKRSTSIHDY